MRVKDSLGIACAIVLILGGRAVATTADSQVGIRLFQFRPRELQITAGTKVTWTNHDDIRHTVTSGTPETRDGRFARRLDGKDTAASVEFTEPGTYAYFCERHPSMRGEIRVN